MTALGSPVVIIGGGLAGLAAACELVHAGRPVRVLETRPRLGGRATSFVDPRTNGVYDNCQHVVVGACTELIRFYERLGLTDAIEWHDELFWTRGGGEIASLRPGWLPAPLHFARSFRRLPLWSFAEKRAIARGMWRLLRLGEAGRVRWRGRTFRAFLDECDQPADLIRSFWNTIIVSACNLDVDRVDAAIAMHVLQDGFLTSKRGASMGVPRIPLVDLYDPMRDVIESNGGTVSLGTSVRSIAWNGSRVTAAVTDDERIEASAVIAAVPFDRLDKLVGTALRQADPRLQRLDRFEVSPILGVHLVFEHAVMAHPHLVLVDRPTHWFFNKGTDTHGGQHVHAVISAADDWMTLDEAEIVQRVLDDLVHVIPAARGIEPVHARAVKEKRATFAAVPGVHEIRPSVQPGTIGLKGGGIDNLFLAGDWVDTGWPATMEGAVRSGRAAAEGVLERR